MFKASHETLDSPVITFVPVKNEAVLYVFMGRILDWLLFREIC